MTLDDDRRLAEGWRTNTGRLPAGVPRCSVPGCERMHAAKGLCDGHYQQWRRGQPLTPLAPAISERAMCAIAHCGNPALRQALCFSHYHRWRNTNSDHGPGPTPPERITAVDVDRMILTPEPDAPRLPIPPVCPEHDPENTWAREVNAAFHARWARLDAASDALEWRAANRRAAS